MLDNQETDLMCPQEAAYFTSLQLMTPAELLKHWDSTEDQSHCEPESYKPAYVNLLREALRTALTSPRAHG
jgi:hypothetical protein